MSEQRTAKNLRLEDDQGESATYIRLEDTGQDLADRWRLQAGETPSDWQPVEYDRPSRGGVGWILPLLIGAVVVGVAGLMIFVGVDRLRNSNIVSSLPIIGSTDDATVADNASTENGQEDVNTAGTGDENQVAEPAVVIQATDTPEPTPDEDDTDSNVNTEAAVEPEAEPTAVLIEEEIGIVSNQYGVNARLQPSTTAEVLRILEQDEEVAILNQLSDEENGIEWLQVLTSEDAEVWVAADFIDITTRLVAEGTGEVVELTDETSAEDITSADVSARVTISSPNGLNARTSPAPDSEIIQVLEDGRTFTAIQRSDDGQWVQVELDDGETGWIFLQLVIPSTDLSALPSISETESRAAEAEAADGSDDAEAAEAEDDAEVAASDDAEATDGEAGSETENADTEAADTEAADTTESGSDSEASTDGSTGIAVVVSSQYGINARPTTSTESEVLGVLDQDSELTAIGRSEDSTWVQVPLEDGTLVWLFTQALTLPDDISSLPVVVPPAVGEPAETLPEPLSSTAAEGDDDEEGNEEVSDVSVEAGGGITSTVPLTLTAAVTGTVTSTDTTTAETDAITTTESITDTGVLTSTIDSDDVLTATESITATETITETDANAEESDSASSDVDATATIISLIDAKARPLPNAGEEAIQGIPNGEVLPALGRTADGFWVQVELTDGTEAWVFANNVELSVAITDLPEVESE